ncbi:MAG: hypothetical protein AAFX00_13845, partial [Pseudomonadota bacterium]
RISDETEIYLDETCNGAFEAKGDGTPGWTFAGPDALPRTHRLSREMVLILDAYVRHMRRPANLLPPG